MTPIIIPTQTLAKLKLRAIKEKNPNINFYVEQYRAELKAKAEAEQKKIADEIEAEQKEAIKEAEKQMLNQHGEVIVNENNGFFGFGFKKS